MTTEGKTDLAGLPEKWREEYRIFDDMATRHQPPRYELVHESAKSAAHAYRTCADELAAALVVQGETHGWQPEVEREVRQYLWLSHGHRMVYGDDGEMQCSECAPFGAWDYKREPITKLIAVIRAKNLKAAMDTALPAPPTGETP